MKKTNANRIRALRIWDILNSETDEDHRMDTEELRRRLAAEGIECERRVIYNDIKALCDGGYEVMTKRGVSNEYYVAERRFSLPELRILMDAVRAAGFVTGLLHVKLKINGLLSGIITMTALLSVNYLIAGGPMVSFSQETTMLHNSFVDGFSRLASNFVQVGLTLVLLAVCKIVLDLYLKTKSGFLLRATGDNPQMVTQLGKNIDNYKMLGLSLANGIVALAGSL